MKNLIYMLILISAFVLNNCTLDRPAQDLAKPHIKKEVVKKNISHRKVKKVKKKALVVSKRVKKHLKKIATKRVLNRVKPKSEVVKNHSIDRKKLQKVTQHKKNSINKTSKSRVEHSNKKIVKKSIKLNPIVAKLKIDHAKTILSLSLKSIDNLYRTSNIMNSKFLYNSKSDKLLSKKLHSRYVTTIKLKDGKEDVAKILKKYKLKVVETFSLKSKKQDPELLGPQSTLKHNPLVRL